MSILVPLAVLWPAGALLALVDGRRRAVGWVAVAVLAAACAALAAVLARALTGGAFYVVAGGWPIDVGIRLRADALGAGFALLSCAVVLAALAHGVVTGIEQRLVPALTVLLALGLTGLFLTGDVFSFYVFFELAMICAYSLAAARGERRQLGAALVFAVVNLLGSFVFLLAVGALYRATGTLEMQEVAQRAGGIDPNTAVLIAVAFFVAFGIKLGLFPFHFWLPSVYSSAPPLVGAILAGALANIGAYGLLRFGVGLLPAEVVLASVALVGVGAVSVVYGSLQAVSRRDTREVLAYSAIGNAGYVLIAIGLGGRVGIAAAVLFAVVNSLNKALLFLAADLRGPLLATAFAVGALSVAGVPPAVGFFGKAALFETGVEAGSVVTVVLLFVGSALAFVYMFQIHQHDFWRPGAESVERQATGLRRLVPVVLAIVVLGLGLWPEPLLALSEAAADDLIGQASR